jgi:hypothetical protein
MSSISWNICLFKADFIFGNRKKSFGAISGEHYGHSISVIHFWARNCLKESALWDGALSWWRVQLLGQSSGLFQSRASHKLLQHFHTISLVDCLALWN